MNARTLRGGFSVSPAQFDVIEDTFMARLSSRCGGRLTCQELSELPPRILASRWAPTGFCQPTGCLLLPEPQHLHAAGIRGSLGHNCATCRKHGYNRLGKSAGDFERLSTPEKGQKARGC